MTYQLLRRTLIKKPLSILWRHRTPPQRGMICSSDMINQQLSLMSHHHHFSTLAFSQRQLRQEPASEEGEIEMNDNDDNDHDNLLIVPGSKDDSFEDIILDDSEEKSMYPAETAEFIVDALKDIDKHLPYSYNGKPIPEAPHGIQPPSVYDYKITHLLFKKIREEPSMDFSIGSVDEIKKLDNRQGADGFPLLEVAFCGRSNVGKSSLVNAVLGYPVSKVSKTPGHTKRLNFFNVGDMVYMVDLPGYGYAEGNMDEIEKWTEVMGHYLASRGERLKRVFVLIDSRRGLTRLDQLVLEFLTMNAVSHQIIFTKCDKIPHEALCDLLEDTYKLIDKDKKYTLCYPYITPCSSLDNMGIEEVKCAIVSGSGLRMSIRLMNEKQKLQVMKKERDRMMKDLGVINPEHPVFKNQKEMLEDMKSSKMQQDLKNKSISASAPQSAPPKKGKLGNQTDKPQKQLPPNKKSIILGLYGEDE